jgi:hypothetical protein
VQTDPQIVDAWLQAATELGIKVIAPFKISTNDAGDWWFEAYIADFGGPNGTVVGNRENQLNEIRKQHGYYASNLFPSYRIFDRQHFIDTLNDWGWFGEKGKAPIWYTGKRWA